ncbi:hypothetical protein ELG78_16550 [Rhizobium leguminosarum]|uniref:hypothetical protein n=1 Tax=Rhizobium leguminosarum TaxID=384 RepID=UPI0010325164|nr:hypothetical protein [Rhizobium leguminosarum]TBG38489.1 hypothetical protein ELG78_16550 [Rhizobium leguminosarum]
MPDWLSQNLNVGNAFTVISLVLAWYFYDKAKQKYFLMYYIRSSVLIDDTDNFSENLKISVNEKIYKRLVVTKVALWNGGNVTIKPQHFVEGRDLLISPSNETEVLGVNVIAVASADNRGSFHWEGRKGAVSVDFNMFRPAEGLVFEILHAGDRNIYSVQGSISEANGKLIKANRAVLGNARKGPLTVIFTTFTLLASPIIFGISLGYAVEVVAQSILKFFSLSSGNTWQDAIASDPWITRYPVIGAVVGVGVLFFFAADVYRLLREQPPKTLASHL